MKHLAVANCDQILFRSGQVSDCKGSILLRRPAIHVLVTAGYGVKPAEQDIHIEFLASKPKP